MEERRVVRATFLVDNFVSGTWKIEKTRRAAILVIEPFEYLPKKDRDVLIEEGERLVRFVGGRHGGVRDLVRGGGLKVNRVASTC